MRTFAHVRKTTEQFKNAGLFLKGHTFSGQNRDVGSMLRRQRSIENVAHGFNQEITHSNTQSEIQRKLTIGTSGDLYEREADCIADQLVRMPGPKRLLSCAERRSKSHPEETPKKQAGAQITPIRSNSETRKTEAPSVVHEVLAMPGQTLDPATRTDAESRFGCDFSEVQLFTHAAAAESAREINARAYTVGNKIVFGRQEYAPGTRNGKKLLFHELTHVVQQNGTDTRQATFLSRLTEEEKAENLRSKKYAGTRRLENAFDNDPPLGIGESGEPVRLIQEGLVADGFDMPASTKSTGELDGAFGSETFTVLKKFQAKYGLRVDGIVGRETMGKLDELELNRKPPPPPDWQPAVDRIDIIDSPSGAVGCFGPILGDSNLNQPGPFNNPSTDNKYPFYGEVTNVHQVHFHLDRGQSSQLIPERFIDATYSYAWYKSPRTGPDGPPAREICRPSKDKLAVADPPGQWALSDSSYPFKLKAHFYLIVSDKSGHRIAQVEYNVDIEKTDKNNVPNKVNRISPTKKRDLVRNRDL